MRNIIITALAGILCLAVTYSSTRSGNLFTSIIVILLIGSAAGMMARWDGNKDTKTSLWSLILVFICGVVLTELVAFTYYYFQTGHNDPKLSVGIGVSIVEAGIVSILGALSLTVAGILTARITRVSN